MKKTQLKQKTGFKRKTLEEVKAKQQKKFNVIGYGLGTWGKTGSTKPKTSPKFNSNTE